METPEEDSAVARPTDYAIMIVLYHHLSATCAMSDMRTGPSALSVWRTIQAASVLPVVLCSIAAAGNKSFLVLFFKKEQPSCPTQPAPAGRLQQRSQRDG
jgi:hypothetical protein